MSQLPIVVIVTNGNIFSNIGIRSVIARLADTCLFKIVVTSGLRRQKGNRFVEATRLVQRWGPRYTSYKAATVIIPRLVDFSGRTALTVPGTCGRSGISCASFRNVNRREGLEYIGRLQPALLVSYSCPYRINNELLEVPTIGALNVHSSLLPEYAGVCTYVHVLADGREATGVTVHEMVERFDAGRIVTQGVVPIGRGMSVAALFTAQSIAAGELLSQAIRTTLELGTIVGREQELAARTYCKEPTSKDIKRLRANGHRVMRMTDWRTLLSSAARGG